MAKTAAAKATATTQTARGDSNASALPGGTEGDDFCGRTELGTFISIRTFWENRLEDSRAERQLGPGGRAARYTDASASYRLSQ